ncbi:MAG: hypothetical protein ACKVRP_14515 [Bacteroidota bacterium]
MNPKKARQAFIVVTIIMCVQFAIYLKGSEPYPAVIHPSFYRIPDKSGVQWFTRPEILVHFADGKTQDINYQRVFNRVQPWFVQQIYRTLEEKGMSKISNPKKFTLGIQTYELRRYILRREDHYTAFKVWLRERLKATLDRDDIEKVEFNLVTFSYRMDEIPITITRGSEKNVETTFLK